MPWEQDVWVGDTIRAYEILREVSRYLYEHGHACEEDCIASIVRNFPGGPLDKEMLQRQIQGCLPGCRSDSAAGVDPGVTRRPEGTGGDSRAAAVQPWQYRDALLVHRPKLQACFHSYLRAATADVLLYPTTHLPARPISDFKVHLSGKARPTYATYTLNTAPTSNAGLCALSLPAGLSGEGVSLRCLLASR